MEYKKLTTFLSNIEKITNYPFIIILRNSMINVVPIIIVGSFFLLILVFFRQFGFFQEYTEFIKKLYLLTMGLVSLYLSAAIGYNYGQYYKKESSIFVLVSLSSFVVSALIYQDWTINAKEFLSFLGVKNMFSCVIISLVSCYLFTKLEINIFKDKSIPSYVLISLNSIIPFFLVVFFVAVLSHFFYFNEFILILLKPFENYGDNIVVVWITNLFLHLTNFLGIHGISLINSVFLSLWQKYLAVNADLVINHKDPIYITAYPFFQWFVWIGGAGATLGLNIALLFSKSSHLRNIGKSSIIFSFFNINEPLLFGLPIVLNPYFLAPFIITPLILGTVSFLFFLLGFVNKPYIEAPWMFPSPIGAFLSTTDIRAILLNLLNIFLSVIIYLPFLKIYEKKLIAEEGKQDKE